MMEAKYYAGVGSRETPLHICKFMTEIARYMETQGWTLRSGGARGADKAFAAGAVRKQIFLPHQGWNGNQSEFFEPSAGAWELAPKFHPNWGACLRSSYKYTPDLMARNGHQVLGPDLETPSRLIICWTPGGSGDGGTGQAIRIGRHYGVPIYDLGNPQELAKIERKIGVLCGGSVTTQRSVMKIEEFTGEWRFLSNFYASPLTIEGITYPTVEHAFQAGKTLDPAQRKAVSGCRTAAEAKRMGRTVTMRGDWDTARVKVMTRLVGLKFRDPQLRALLLATEGKELIEGNAWNDTFWGVCRGSGENHLGKILMEVRGSKLQDAQDIPAVTTNREGTMTMQVVNKYGHTPCDKDVWIMRNNSPSNGGVALPCLGNPFGESAYAPIRVATREIAVAEYKKWLTVKVKTEKDPQIIDALRSIPEDANLVCCCAPRTCHGTVVAAACRWLRQNPDFK